MRFAAALIERFVSAGAVPVSVHIFSCASRRSVRVSVTATAAKRSRMRALREGLEPAEIEGRTGVLRERVRTSDGPWRY
ncbi:MAG: hypothetical protein U0235_17975 [Polyangiaceae bacterium]